MTDGMSLKMLQDEGVARIHEKTLEVLSKTGIHIHDCPEAAEIFRKGGCTVDNGRVLIPRKVVEDCIRALPDRETLRICNNVMGFGEPAGLGKGVVHPGLIGNSYYRYDHVSGRKDLVEADLHDKDLILDHLENFRFDCNTMLTARLRQNQPGDPYATTEDCSAFLRTRLRNRTGTTKRRMPLHLIINRGTEDRPRIMAVDRLHPLERMEVLRHMVVHGPRATEALMADDTPMIWCNPVSPMQLHPIQLLEIMEGIRAYGSRCFVMFSPEVMSGATGPVTLAGTLIQHNAEVVSGMVFTQLCRPGTAVIYGSVTGVMDMRIADISLGSFESQAIGAALVQLADFYGMPNRIQIGNSSSVRTGPRSAIEATLGIQMGIAAGVNLMTTGLLDSSLMMSYEHLVVMDELFNQFGSIARIDLSDLDLDAAVVMEEGHPSPGYLTSDHTLEYMKRSVYSSEYTGRIESSYTDYYDLAHAKVQRILERRNPDVAVDRLVDEKSAAVLARLEEGGEAWRKDGDWWRTYVRDLE